ncbi:MAG TPA: carboxypeptidase-like regulatory domain-containing protein [Candidatus Acidoferrum sp.]|nr:carboxypeptidase-like regulatory domain-containing protein [Candidatus Acidoferrum sp.]
MATLAGRAVSLDGIKSRLQLFLKGVPGTTVKDEYHLLRTDQQGNFRFADVVPGDYMLTNAIAGPPAWRLRVSLAKGEHLTLDLSPANQITVRDDFPESRP